MKEGDTCTQEQADDWVAGEFERASVDVLCLSTVYLSTCQRYALADFIFNLGRGALRGSTLLKKLNAGDYEGAAAEFPKWNKVRVNGVLQVSPGLARRRLAEQAMFEGRDWRAA